VRLVGGIVFKLGESGTVVVVVVVVVAVVVVAVVAVVAVAVAVGGVVVVGCGSRRPRYGLTLSPSHLKSSLSLFPTG
jgi:hypothetical protein